MNIRRSILAAVGLATLTLLPVGQISAQSYLLDSSHTSVVFSVSHMNLSYTYGIFREVQGSYYLDRANPTNCWFRLTIQAKSIDTNNSTRDEHLTGTDFFNVAQFPTISFESTSVGRVNTQSGVKYQVTGNLTMHGVTRQITIPLELLAEGPGPRGNPRTGFLSQFTLKRGDWEMKNLPQFVGDPISVTVSFEGVQQQPGGSQPIP